MHERSLSYLGQKDGPSYNEVALRAGVDRGNLKEQVENSRRTGEPLSKRLEADVFDALCAIHEEYPLHSYPRFLMTTLRVMRECETKSLTRFRSAAEHHLARSTHDDEDDQKNNRVKALKEAFETAARQVTDPFSPWIIAALRLLEQDRYAHEDLGTLYIGAAALQTVVELWEDAATAITDLHPVQPAEAVIDFEYMNMDGLVTVLNVVEKSMDLYEELDAALIHQVRDAKEQRKVMLLQHDRQIVNIQLAALGSHALDWLRASPELLSRMGLPTQLIHKTAQSLSQRTGTAALRNSTALLERHPHNLVLARNVIIMARQIGGGGSKIEEIARDHVATLLNLTADEVYSLEWLEGRKALLEEPPFKTVRPIVT